MSSPTPSEIRSQAVAKLKRAASLPRTPRRPSNAQINDSNEGEPQTPDHDDEEMLATSPQPSSSYDTREDSLSPYMPTPSSSRSINSQNPSPTPDRSYLLPPGRSTPSPLPTLGELRMLSRSNSAAARSNAMKKLMGDSTTPDAPIIRPSLQRADSLGARPDVPVVAVSPEHEEEDAFSSAQTTRLARSHTVGAGGGEERRSAVGRRMMARLGNRTPVEAPQAESEQAQESASPMLVRQLSLSELRARAQMKKAAEEAAEEPEPEPVPLISPPSTEELRASPIGLGPGPGLAPAERSVSRGTNFSTGTGEEAFEYEHHLRRSMSGRTARTAEVVPRDSQDTQREEPGPDDVETITGQFNDADLGLPLPPPQPLFHNATMHTPHGSTSTAMTESPGGSSTTDVLGQMVFVVGDRSQARGFSGTYPVGIDDAQGIWRDDHTAGEGVGSPSGPSSLYGEQQEGASNGGRSVSAMSWEEVPGPQDVGVPIDRKYHQKSDSVVSKIERSLRGTLRKSRRGSSSTTSETPTSPSMRRESEASNISQLPRKNSQASMSRKPSYASLAPLDSRTGSILSVPVVASGKSSPLPMPTADALDARYLDSKLSPFPGMAQLEEERNRKRSDAGEEIPRLVHQSSDPIVPQSRPAIASGDSSMSLPTVGQQTQYIDLPSDLAESSAGRKGWLAKAFSQQTRGKRPSISDSFRKLSDTPTSPEKLQEGEDPFAAAPLKSPQSAPRHRSASPSVSVVHEGSDEGSRWTRFSTAMQDKPSPLSQPLQPQSVEVLNRLDAVLSLSGDDPARPTMLDDPPRKLLLCSQVLQVVNSYTVKDRYLFLFTDILVIAKPLLVNNEPANLDMKFVVKSVVSLDKVSVSGLRDDDAVTDNRAHPVVQSFIERFGHDPVSAVDYLVERSNPKVDEVTLASLLFKTPELDRAQIGLYLASPARKVTLKAFIDRFHFAGVRIDDALRMLLLSVRLPTEANASELLLKGFATRWYEANHDTISFDRELALDLVLAIMQLNDALNPSSGFGYFAFANQAISVEDFIGAFRAKDTRQSVQNDLLYDIYDSVREDMLVQALPASRQDEERYISIQPRLPSKLTYNVWSEPITVRISHADPDFGIRLHGEGLYFEPSALDFTTSATQTFRVRGSALGVKSMLFDRVGLNAALYASIGNTRTFAVERAFMAHTFQIAFVNHLNTKRKYCFSVDDAETRKRWGQVLLAQVKRAAVPRGLPADPKQRQVRVAAETVALQVLRDAVIGREEKVGKAPRGRSGSVSAVYALRAGQAEVGLPLQTHPGTAPLTDKDSGLLEVQSGKELVLLCRQNSLLPLVLGFLQGGVPGPNVV